MIPHRRRLEALIFTAALIAPTTAFAQQPASEPESSLSLDGFEADPAVPSSKQVLGHGFGADISSPEEAHRYLAVLAAAAPERCRLEDYGSSYGGRPLRTLTISSAQNIARLEQLRAQNLSLHDPRRLDEAHAKALFTSAPAVVWLAYSVHGNEISSTDAALMTAYRLLADRRPATRALLDRLVVIIDPLQNPDGRARFISAYRENRGRYPDAAPVAREHTERWTSGRSNHYRFDMNRDWFRQSQRESRAKVAAYLRWQPQLYVDAHEMGRNSSYYFPPPAEPINPMLLDRQRDALLRLGRHQARRFDERGYAYMTREVFDAFYPGYGSEWPTLQGGLGILWEMASARGLIIDRDDQRQLSYRDGVLRHTVSGLATLEFAARERPRLLEDFYRSAAESVRLGREGPARHAFLLEGERPGRAARLATLLRHNGLEVGRLKSPLRLLPEAAFGRAAARDVPAGSYHVDFAQPAGRLARSLLDRRVEMAEAFVAEQLARKAVRLPDQIYDVTSWSLPLAFDVPCLVTATSPEVEGAPFGERAAGHLAPAKASVCYLLSGDDDGAPRALVGWLRQGLRVQVADRSFELKGRRFPAGSLVLKAAENKAILHEQVAAAARRHGLDVMPSDTAFVDSGASLGGRSMRWVAPPKVALLFDRPTSYASGHIWHLFEQHLEMPVTRVAGRDLGRLKLEDFNVLILPHGDYSDADAPSDAQVTRLKRWVAGGGTLILIEGAASWACDPKVALLASDRLRLPVSDEQKARFKRRGDKDAKPPKGELPTGVPGAFLNAEVFERHWLAYGAPARLPVFFDGNTMLAPIAPEDGRNIVRFVKNDSLLASGFCWPKSAERVAGSAWLLTERRGRGHIVAFADDPCYRAMYPSLRRFFINAALFGPAH